MAKVTLRASGGLNKDLDPNNLPEGDYSDANNIVFDTGKAGGAGAIRMLEAFAATGITYPDTVKATFQNADGLIYVLTKNATKAAIHRIDTAISTTTQLFIYTHGVTTDFVPDLVVLGTSIVWNYCESGTVLIHSLDRTVSGGEYTTLADLKLQKKTPNNVVTIQKYLTGGNPVEFLEANDFQFASRYKYDSGEFSVLSNYSQMYKGEKGTVKYIFAFDFSGTPTYVTEIEIYVKIGNIGTWRRMATQLKSVTDPITWVGQIYESLDIITSSKSFDAVPVNANHIEAAKNRIFLANIQDDYTADNANKLTFTVTNGYALGTSGTSKSYITGETGSTYSATSSETTANGSGYVKPLANNSTYDVGIAFYDEALKTRGVEAYSKIQTGKFAYPIIPTIAVTPTTGWVKPTWAKYAQLVYTKNKEKSFIFEGFASNIYFEIEITETNAITKEVTTFDGPRQSITIDDVNKVKYLVVDIMGMYKTGQYYTYQKGDKISINTGTDAGLLEMDIYSQKDNLIYCIYTKGVAVTMPSIPVPANLFFEIYTPKQIQEEQDLVFYESGSLVDISSWTVGTGTTFSGDGLLNSTKFIGDMVFTKLSIPTYKTEPFKSNLEITDPQVVVLNRTTEVYCAMSSEIVNDYSYNVQELEKTQKISPLFTTIGTGATNQDGAVILDANKVPVTGGASGPTVRLANFYINSKQDPTSNYISVNYNLKVTYSINYISRTDGNDPSGNWAYYLKSQIMRVPYDNKKNVYLDAVKFGKYETFPGIVGSYASTSGTIGLAGQHKLILPTDINVDINANDQFYIDLSFVYILQGEVSGGSILLSKATTGQAVTFKVLANKTEAKVTSIYNTSTELNTTNSNFIVRNISNATTNPNWNTSSGKPLVLASKVVSPRRTNTIRYSGNYVPGTKINNLNSFFALDSNDTPIENGDIMSLQRASRLQGNGAMLLVMSKRECSYIFLGEQELSQGNNASIRALTSNLIGTIRSMGNGIGLQDKASVMNYKGVIWWWDDFTKKVAKYTDQGIEVISDIFMKSYFRGQGGTSNSASFAYDPFYNMVIVGFNSSNVSVGYSDNLKRWVSFYDFRTGFSESYGDRMVLIKDNIVYLSLQSGYNTFFGGTTYDSSITFLLNSKYPVLPRNLAIWHNMNVTDYTQSNYVKSGILSIDITNENNQVSKLLPSNFLVEDNRLYAHILRDKNTTGTIVESNLITGNYIVGYLNKFVLNLLDRSQSMKINSIDIEIEPVSGHS